jgi:hypothetical protein
MLLLPVVVVIHAVVVVMAWGCGAPSHASINK